MKELRFSALARVYLDHHEAIQAGWSALLADMPALLEGVARELRRRHGQPVVQYADQLERVWPDLTPGLSVGVPLVLRLRWSAASPLHPVLTLNLGPDEKNEVPSQARFVLDDPFWAPWRGQLPEIEVGALLEHPGQALLDAWLKACEAVERLRRSSHARRRSAALVVLAEVSHLLWARREELAELGASLPKAAGSLSAEEGWPAYVQLDWVAGDRPQAWTLTWGQGEEDGPDALWLVLYDGRGVEVPRATPEPYLGSFPSVGSFGDWLEEVAALEDAQAQRARAVEVAQRVAEAWVGLVRAASAGR
jgi:hypothetical protein